MNPEPHEVQKNLSEDLKTFEELPEKTQKMLLLGDEAERASGKARASVDRQIKPHSKRTKQ